METDATGAATETSQSSALAPNPNSATSMPPPEQGLKCPRCDSPNTKFCYYNNYSLSQPRHFCKTCRRYWTKGGALRNVPVGGGCRKNKKSKSSALSRLSLVPTDHIVGNFSDHGVGLQNLLSAPSQLVAAASDFQLGVLPFSRLHSPNSYSMSTTNKYLSPGEIPSHGSAFSPPTISTTSTLGYPASSAGTYGKIMSNGSSQGVGAGTIASSIESLSFINQDLHLKLQQQRMAMLFGGEAKEADCVAAPVAEAGQMQNISPDFGECSGLQKVWFTDGSFAVSTGASTGASKIGSDDGINNTGNNGNNPNYWNGAGSSGWNDMPQFTAMP